MTKRSSMLLGGVPFGCNNVGDEAIMECAVAIFREACPEAAITVSAGTEPDTPARLNVQRCALFGFAEKGDHSAMAAEIRSHDVFVWCGATGLSDYPEVTLEMLRIAQAAGKKTILWGVGMNDELNPVHYTVLPGRRWKLLRVATALTLGLFDAVRIEEQRRKRRAHKKIARYVERADLVMVRDPETKEELRNCGVRGDILVGADSALLLQPAPLNEVALSDAMRTVLQSDHKKIGICISAQREIQQQEALLGYLNRVVDESAAQVVFLPMNPLTDARLMTDLHAQMDQPTRAAVLEGERSPAEMLAVLLTLDLVVSSRLHLLILASIAHVPFIGISRGSKVDNFLRPFGLETVGTTECFDGGALWEQTLHLLAHREAFEGKSIATRRLLLDRLDAAQKELCKIFRG